MPMFYFNLSGQVASENVDGENLPSLVEAMQEATRIAHDLARNRRASDASGEVVVTDESGREVFRMPLKGAL